MGFNSGFKGLNVNSLEGVSKNTQISNFMKIRPVGAELFHTDGQTDRQTDKKDLTVAFRNFANVPKKKEPLLSTITRNYGYQFMQNDSLTCVCQCRSH
jgi:hypothetical protein